jgi:hypothetical protein
LIVNTPLDVLLEEYPKVDPPSNRLLVRDVDKAADWIAGG